MTTVNTRLANGRTLAKTKTLEWDGRYWHVPSQAGTNTYIVDIDEKNAPTCTCPDFEVHGERCKHIYAVETHLRQQVMWAEDELAQADAKPTQAIYIPTRPKPEKPEPKPEPVPEKPKKPTYRQDWTAYNTAQTNEKAHFQALLFDLVKDIPDAVYTFGRPRLPLREMLFCATFKIYSTVSCRRFMCDLEDAKDKGYIEHVPHFNSIYNYLELPELTPVLRDLIERSSLPMKAVETIFAVDSSGFTTCNYVRWYDAKYGEEREQREWIKAHLMCGVTTNVVTSVEITPGTGGDSPRFRPLVKATARNFEIEEVSADKAYSGRKNLEEVSRLGAVPYIPFKENATGTGVKSAVWTRLYHYYSYQREEFLGHYHRRSLVESTFAMIKAMFGAALRSKGETAQVNEVLCKVLCHNICCVIQSMYELGIEPVFWHQDD